MVNLAFQPYSCYFFNLSYTPIALKTNLITSFSYYELRINECANS